MHRSALLALLALLLLLTACASNPPAPLPPASAVAVPEIQPVHAVLASPQQWSGRTLTLVSPVRITADERVLTNATLDDGSGKSDPPGIWLAEPLPDEVRNELEDGRGIVELQGQLSPPGAWGREQGWTYQFTADQARVLQPERTTIANLALNPQALNRIVLTLDGTLLLRGDTALLVDNVGEGGVPASSAREIKVVDDAIDAATTQRLAQSGDVRWGEVRVVGWWQDGVLTPWGVEVGE
jgi:predicted small lipoprotein YifL